MKACKTCQRPVTNLHMTYCATCDREANQLTAAYQAKRLNAPPLKNLISISEEELQSMRRITIKESKDLTARKKRLQKMQQELDTADRGWAFLWIESERRRKFNAMETQLDTDIRTDEANIQKLRIVRQNVDKMIKEIGG